MKPTTSHNGRGSSHQRNGRHPCTCDQQSIRSSSWRSYCREPSRYKSLHAPRARDGRGRWAINCCLWSQDGAQASPVSEPFALARWAAVCALTSNVGSHSYSIGYVDLSWCSPPEPSRERHRECRACFVCSKLLKTMIANSLIEYAVNMLICCFWA